MADYRILVLASMSKLETLGLPGTADYVVRASAKGLSATAKVKSSEQEAAQRALTNLLAKVDAITDLSTKLGEKPAPQKPRGIAAARAKAAAAQTGGTELTLSDGTVLNIPDEDPVDRIIQTNADPNPTTQDDSVEIDL